jgi:rhomboid protease GluP
MAIGFNPKYNITLPLNNLTAQQFLTIALKTVKDLNWEVARVTDSSLTAYTGTSMFKNNSEIKLMVTDLEAVLTSTSLGSEMMDFGANRKYTKAFTERFNETNESITAEELTALTEDLDRVAASNPNPEEEPQTAPQSIKSFFLSFVPQKGYVVTPIIIDINIIIFLLMALSGVNILEPDTESLINWGASLNPLVVQGQSWRLFTNMFLHIGIIHLLLNMYALAYIGLLLEHRIGTFKFAVAYLCTGIAASVVSVWWHAFTVSAGASGAIFGLYGVFLALLTGNFIDKEMRKALLTSISVFIGYNLIYGLKEGIDNAAHIGGLASGVLIGFAFIPSLQKPERKNLHYLTLAGTTACILLAATVVVSVLPNDYGVYETKMKTFYKQESAAMKVFALPNNAKKEAILAELNRGNYYWQANMALVKEADALDLPETVHSRNKKILEYTQLRFKSFQLMYQAVATNTDAYKAQLDDCNNQIEKVLNDLKQQ